MNFSTEKISGIYKIINRINGKYYVDSSDNICAKDGRWTEHINTLQSNSHDNDHLQKSWNKYGKDNFQFLIIEVVPKNNLLVVEQKYLDIAKLEKENCYNLSFRASSGGFAGHKHSEKSKLQTSLKLKGIPKRTRGIPRPQSSGNKNPRWKSVDDVTKNILFGIYKSSGYGALKRKAKELFDLGGTVVHRLYKDFTTKITI